MRIWIAVVLCACVLQTWALKDAFRKLKEIPGNVLTRVKQMPIDFINKVKEAGRKIGAALSSIKQFVGSKLKKEKSEPPNIQHPNVPISSQNVDPKPSYAHLIYQPNF
ncbi:hypothetical protein GE061_007757 [Apolygus lucorum]|uniref:Uncharacterized protein n=1 Tax=Apolygus lucorum TaxID=248454 RepID=A0A6A4IKH5_APOLU|nr:hypothetical protein GE061_007757 [Apolygus lucorum]